MHHPVEAPSGSGRRQQPPPGQGSAQNPGGPGPPSSRRNTGAPTSAAQAPARAKGRTAAQRSTAAAAEAVAVQSALPAAPDAQLTVLLHLATSQFQPPVSCCSDHYSHQKSLETPNILSAPVRSRRPSLRLRFAYCIQSPTYQEPELGSHSALELGTNFTLQYLTSW